MSNPITEVAPKFLLVRGVHKGFVWEVASNGFGFRCGYVAVPLGHPWHGMTRFNVPAMAHKGVNYSEPGTSGEWWFGFDCGQAGDEADPALVDAGLPPRVRDRVLQLIDVTDMIRQASCLPGHLIGTVKDDSYVVAECVRLAEQAAALTAPQLPKPDRPERLALGRGWT